MVTITRTDQIKRVTIQGSFINFVLTIGKLIAGIVGNSTAMIADAIHSLSDFITDIIVIAFVNVSGKDYDENHPYGHGKFETFATVLISIALFMVGIGILYSSTIKIIEILNGVVIEKPKYIAFYAALVSIVVKEGLYWYTKIKGEQLNSHSMIANAWHHRSDAFSSIGAAFGILGAILLGDKWIVLDPVTGVIVSFFILKVSWDIAKPGIDELLDSSLPQLTQDEIKKIISGVEGVEDFHKLKTRKVGDIISIEVHVEVDKNMTVETSHDIATNIENLLRNKYGAKTHTIVHIEPYRN